MDITSLFDWFKGQVEIVLYMVIIGLLLFTAWKRAWILMVGVLLGGAFIAIFVANPNMITTLGQWMSNKLSMGR